MSRRRFVPRPTSMPTGIGFESAEEAWLWAARAVRWAQSGANLTANSALVRRLCEPRDLINLVARLQRERHMSGQEFEVLCRFGVLDRPPDRRDPAEGPDADIWYAALQKVEVALRRKGLVGVPANEDVAGREIAKIGT